MPVDALLPLVLPGSELSAEERSRYARQLRLEGIGELGQRRLKNARVLVVGAGGLGSPVLLYLAGAGVGTIGIADGDTVAASNLQRQVLHPTGAVGTAKVISAAASLAAANPLVHVIQHAAFVTAGSADEILTGYDVVVDGTDNFETRYVLSDAAARAGIPCVWGSVLRFDGQVSVFWDTPPGRPGVTLRDLHPPGAATDSAESCVDAGVLGPLCGWVGSVMAGEVIKLLVGFGRPLLGRVLVLDALDGTTAELAFRRADTAGTPETGPGPGPGPGGADRGARSIGWEEADALLAAGRPVALLDVRARDEREPAPLAGSLRIPHDALPVSADESPLAAVDRSKPLLVYCRSGARSDLAAERLRELGFPLAVSLRGGLLARPAERVSGSDEHPEGMLDQGHERRHPLRRDGSVDHAVVG